MKNMLLTILSLALLALGPAAESAPAGEAANQPCTIEQVCAGQVTEFKGLAEVRDLETRVEDYESEEPCDLVKNSLFDLHVVARSALENEACGPVVGEKFRDLVNSNLGNHTELPMPEAGQRFARALCFDVNAHCKVDLLKQLPELEAFYNAEELEPVARLEAAGAMMLDDSLEYHSSDPVRVAMQMLHMLTHADADGLAGNVTVAPETVEAMKDLQAACKNTYYVSYYRLFDMFLKLYEAGYDYSTSGTLVPAEAREQLNSNPTIRRWLNVMIVCEALDQTDIFDRPLDYSKFKRIAYTAFPSDNMADQLRVDMERDGQSIEMAKFASDSEAEQLTAKIYRKYVDTELAQDRLLEASENKLWLGYIHHLAAKVGAQ